MKVRRKPGGKAPKRLPQRFYERPADVVARELLGCVLVRRWRRLELAGRIVETEAYVGQQDRACHASRGRTARNDVMFGPAGYAYVYFIYGMYDMLNVVCQPPGVPEAVLIRALEPVHGVDTMKRWRGVRRDVDIASGPGKLCRALRVSRTQNGATLRGETLWIAPGPLRNGESLGTSARIGVDYAGADAGLPLRFFIAGHPHVSKGRPSASAR